MTKRFFFVKTPVLESPHEEQPPITKEAPKEKADPELEKRRTEGPGGPIFNPYVDDCYQLGDPPSVIKALNL
jgi:hypothetical protein